MESDAMEGMKSHAMEGTETHAMEGKEIDPRKAFILLTIELLRHHNFIESSHRLEQESNFLNLEYVEELANNGNWDEAEKYLFGFEDIDKNTFPYHAFVCIQLLKYIEALHKKDGSRALEIFYEDLKVLNDVKFAKKYDLNDLWGLLHVDNIWDHEILKTDGNIQMMRRLAFQYVRVGITSDPILAAKLKPPNGSLNYEPLEKMLMLGFIMEFQQLVLSDEPEYNYLFSDKMEPTLEIEDKKWFSIPWSTMPILIGETGNPKEPTDVKFESGLETLLLDAMSTLRPTNELILRMIELLVEKGYPESSHKLEQESGLFLDMDYVEHLANNADLDEAEKYLSGFTKIDQNKSSRQMFSHIRFHKYIEALNKKDYSKAFGIQKELKAFNKIWEYDPTKCGDMQSVRKEMFKKIKAAIEQNPLLSNKRELLTIGRIKELMKKCFVLVRQTHSIFLNPDDNKSLLARRKFVPFSSTSLPAMCVAFHPKDNDVIAVGMADSVIHIYNRQLNKSPTKLRGHDKEVTGLAFSTVLDVLISAGADAQLCVWATDEWKKLDGKFIQIPPERASHLTQIHVKCHPEQNQFLAVHETMLAIYEAPQLKCVSQWMPKRSSGGITDATYSCDGEVICASFRDGSLEVLSCTIQNLLRIISHI